MIERRKKVSVNLNIAPLIDVVFQLLLFFALTAYFVAHQGIEVSLPNSQSAVPIQRQQVTVFVTKNGEVYYNSEKIAISQLSNMLMQSKLDNQTVILKSDESVHLGLIVKVIDEIKRAGLKDLVIATEKVIEQ